MRRLDRHWLDAYIETVEYKWIMLMTKIEYSETSRDVLFVPPHSENLIRFQGRFLNQDRFIIKFSHQVDCWPQHYEKDQEELMALVELPDYFEYPEKVISVTYWPPSYGHVFETMFHAYDILKSDKHCDYKVLLCIPPEMHNMLEIGNLLFGDRLINAFDLDNKKIIVFKSLFLIHNYPQTANWHQWANKEMKQKIKNYFNTFNHDNYERVFLTRTKHSKHDEWSMLENLSEIEELFIKNNYKVIDPQRITDAELYHNIKKSKILVTTNGSALTPLVLLDDFQGRVFCLNSKRYLPEWRRNCSSVTEVEDALRINPSLVHLDFEKSLWSPITSKIDFTYIDSFNNKIEPEIISKLIFN